MKVCFSSFTCPTWDLTQILTAARDLGYHGVDLRAGAHHNHGVEIDTAPEKRQALKEEFKLRGIDAVCLSTGIQLADPDALELIQSRIKLAADVGFDAIRVLCGKPEQEMGQSDFIDHIGATLARAAVLGERQNVAVWLETHDEMSRAFLASAVLRRADHDNAGIVYNTLHPYRMGESVDDTFEALGKNISYVRFHDGLKDPGKVVIRPMGQGDLPLDKIFSNLLIAGYNGYLCAEWFHDQYGTSPVETLKLYHKEITRLIDNHGAALDFMV